MAKIFISSAANDEKLVGQYINALRKYKHEISEESFSEMSLDVVSAAFSAQSEADGTVCFITRNSISNSGMKEEMSNAYYLMNDSENPRFLIPVIFENAPLPELVNTVTAIHTNDLSVEQVVKKIDTAINDFLEAKRSVSKKTQNRRERSTKTESVSKAPASIIAEGAKGKMVTALQEKLKAIGFFNSVADGIYGRATTEAVRNFQERNGIKPTGEWNEESENKYRQLQTDAGHNNDDPYFNQDGFTGSASDQQVNPISNINPAQSNVDVPGYWFLKIYADTWGTENINENDEGYFSSYLNPKEPRPDYEKFKQIRTGDKIVAYDQSSLKSVLFLFEVTAPLQKDPGGEEIFKFRVIQFVHPYIPYGSFSSYLSFSPDTAGTEELSLFSMSATEYDSITRLIPATNTPAGGVTAAPPIFNKATLSEVFSDSASKDIADQLGFEADVNALAAVIAYEEVKPPLAVGLFGHWGSGKSFFMNKLQKRIEELAGDESGVFCKEVVQINFNSWHYSDSNLWASLITKIFDDLKKYGEGNQAKLDNLFRNLNSTQELLNETKQKFDKVEQEINSLKGRQTAVEIEIKKNTQGLKSLSLDDITRIVMTDPAVDEKIQELKDRFEFLNVKEYEEIGTNIKEIETGGQRLVKGIQILYSFRTWKSWFALFMAVFIFGVVYYAVSEAPQLEKHLGKYKEIIGGLALLVSQAVLFLRPWLKRIKEGYNKLSSLKQTADAAMAREQNKTNAKREVIKTRLQRAELIQTNLRTEIEQLESTKTQLRIEITDISSGKKIVRFIEGRVTDERYMNSLGIISWIRKDFEELDFLLKQQYDAEKMKELNREAVGNMFKIDRIILYIDDLDRCDVAIVVRVLEAINLLLAFPLFVVIVGVDPRWMHSALEVKYAQMLSSDHAKTNDNKQTPLTEMGNPATSYDYLEKIFQIPFVLKPMDRTGKDNLIKSQLQNKPAKTKQQQEEEEEEKDVHTHHQPGTEDMEHDETDKETGEQEEQDKEAAEAERIAAEKRRLEEALKAAADRKKNETVAKPALESLLIADEEISFMQGIGFLIGDSPRTIKRYVNMYRIIRTHAMFAFTDDNYLEHYYAAMVLLAVITGSPDEAPDFFEKIRLFDETKTFNDFLTKHAASFKTNADKTGAIKTAVEKEKAVKPLGNILISKFSKNIDLVSRFSFRHLQDQK